MLKLDSVLAIEGSEKGCPAFIKHGQVLAALVLETGFAGRWDCQAASAILPSPHFQLLV